MSLAQSASLPLSSHPSLDKNKDTTVIATALTFLQPRTLDEHSIKEFSLWGLNGLNAIDPALSLREENGKLNLYQGQAIIYSEAPPLADDVKIWTQLTINMWSSAWDHSAMIRSSQNQGMVQAFFDELFDHMDPYSRYIGPSPATTDRHARTGGEASAGITLAKQGNFIVISSINTNGPAWIAGVNVGQRLYKVNEKRTAKQSVETVNNWLKGPEKSPLSLTLGGPGKAKTQVIRLQRESVPPATVFAFSNDDIFILKITSFSTYTAEEISQYIDQATQDLKLKGLILDLRGNRGGVLQQAITTSALFVDQGVAATTQGRDPDANHVWAVQGGDLTNGVPIVILVDGRTASAAEILTATLADHKRAVVIGSTTLGKGLVQTIAQLPDNGELFVTWSRVLAPLGWPLQGLGVMPQLCTSRGEQFIQQQLKELGAGQSSFKSIVINSRQARYPLSPKSIQTIRSACPSALGTDADLDVANTLILKPDLYKQALSLLPNE